MILLLLQVALAGGPHTNPAACGRCHERTEDGAWGAARPDTETCVACHKDADMHPVGVPPTAQVPAPAGWPLVQGALSCRTCHDQPVHAGHGDLPKPFLRGGPYPSTQAFCFSCHDASAYRRSDPHHPEGSQQSCAVCHVQVPAAGSAPDAAGLRGPALSACLTCHPTTPHVGAATHLGRLASTAALPLGAGGAIGCWTCHDVHDGGAAKRDSPTPFSAAHSRAAGQGAWSGVPDDATWPGADPAGHPPLLALPLGGDQLCAACHGEGP